MKKLTFLALLLAVLMPGGVLAVSNGSGGNTDQYPYPLPPIPNPISSMGSNSNGNTTDHYPLPPVPVPTPSPCANSNPCLSSGGVGNMMPPVKFELSPEQIKTLLQGLRNASSDPSSTMIIKDTLKVGSSDTDSKAPVKRLQIFLNGMGCNLATTGNFGSQTRRCVMNFQKKEGLRQDGVVGPMVRKAISQEIEQNTNSTPPTTQTGQ